MTIVLAPDFFDQQVDPIVAPAVGCGSCGAGDATIDDGITIVEFPAVITEFTDDVIPVDVPGPILVIEQKKQSMMLALLLLFGLWVLQ